MATIHIGKAMPEWGWLQDFFGDRQLVLSTKWGGKAVYEDRKGSSIELIGKDLIYEGHAIAGGTVATVIFRDALGGTLVSVADGGYKAATLSEAIDGDPSLWNLLSALTAGNDRIFGGARGASLTFGADDGDDIVVAGAGGAFMGGSRGDDNFRGGRGWDSLSFEGTYWRADARQGIVLDVTAGTVRDSWGGLDRIVGIDEFRGSVFGDVMRGGASDEYLSGLAGDDRIVGGAGTDALLYHMDARFGGKAGIVANLAKGRVTDGFGDVDHVSKVEQVFGTSRADRFIGNGADNVFRGLGGVDSFDGGKGVDAIDFSWWEALGQHGVAVDLTRDKLQIRDDGFGHRETVQGIEAITGSDYDDRIRLAGKGWASCGDGDDRLLAGRGQNWLGGGAGADLFVFLDVRYSTGIAYDVIGDFDRREGDRVDLSALADLDFLGAAHFSGTGDEVRFGFKGSDTFLYVDLDGDRKAEFEVKLEGRITIQAADLVL